jgi:transposase
MRTFRISGDYEEVDQAFGSSTDVRERERLQTIRMGMSGQYSIAEIAEALGRSRTVIWRWADKYRKSGIVGLLERKAAPGKKGKLGPEVIEEITKGLQEGRWKRAKETRAWLKTTHKVKLSLKGMYYWLGKLGGVLKVPRKTHAKKDAAAAECFKAELSSRLKALNIPEGKPVRVWMEDEHRYGLISVLRKVWTLRGCKPVSPYQTRYQWGYLYGALEVEGSGATEFLFSPTVNIEASQAFLNQIAASDKDAEHVVIWDGAGFHQKPGTHPIPERVHLLQLPPYSPELNPVEKLWDQLKDEIGNHLYETLEEIEATITPLLEAYWSDARKVRSLIGNGWLQAQVNTSSPV